jgi:subtilisin family serine protease
LLALAIAASIACAQSMPQPSPRPADIVETPKQLRGQQVVVTLAGGDAPQWEAIKQALASQYGLRATGTFPLASIRVGCLVFEVPAGQHLDDVLAQLRADPRVESVQVNQLFDGASREHTDAYAGLQYGAVAIGAAAAHGVATGKGVRIAIVDTGVDVEHPDLRGRIAKTANFVDGGDKSFNADRHGTEVAGIIGARADDAIGIFGVAPDAELVAAKACWYANAQTAKATCSSWSLARAIDFAIGEHSQVLNLSLTGPPDPLLARLLSAAEVREITVVAAAAEDRAGPGFPAAMQSVIAVVAGDAIGRVPIPAWVESKAAIAAPGVEILTTTPGGRYDFASGSSLAAAEVSGVVALLIEKNNDMKPAEIRALLLRTMHPATTTGAAPTSSSPGIVDACAALAELRAIPGCS